MTTNHDRHFQEPDVNDLYKLEWVSMLLYGLFELERAKALGIIDDYVPLSIQDRVGFCQDKAKMYMRGQQSNESLGQWISRQRENAQHASDE